MISFIRNNLVFLVLSLGISPLASSIHGTNVKLPFLLLGVIWTLIQKKDFVTIVKKSIKSGKVKFMFTLTNIMFLVGCITGGNVLNVLLDYMAIMSFSLFFFMQLNSNEEYSIVENFSIRLCFAISFLELFLIYFNLYEPGDEENRIINLVICPFFLSLHYLSKKKMIVSLSFVLVMVYMSVVSSMRVNFFFPICYVINLLLIVFTNRDYGIGKKIFIVSSIIACTMVIFPIAKAYIEADHLRYINTVARIEALYEKDSNFDESARTGSIDAIIDNPLDFIIPQGLGWQNHTKNIQSKYRSTYNVLSSMDSSIMYCFYHYGLFFGIWLILSIALSMLNALKNNFRIMKYPLQEINNYVLLNVFVMFLLKSWIFVYFSFGIIYGLLSSISMNAKFKGNE